MEFENRRGSVDPALKLKLSLAFQSQRLNYWAIFILDSAV